MACPSNRTGSGPDPHAPAASVVIAVGEAPPLLTGGARDAAAAADAA